MFKARTKLSRCKCVCVRVRTRTCVHVHKQRNMHQKHTERRNITKLFAGGLVLSGMCSKGFLFNSGDLGFRVCSLRVAVLVTTVSVNRQPFATCLRDKTEVSSVTQSVFFVRRDILRVPEVERVYQECRSKRYLARASCRIVAPGAPCSMK